MVAETVSLSHKLKLEQDHGPWPEQSTSTTESWIKSKSQYSARSPARATARVRGIEPDPEGWEGTQEAICEVDGI
jgi:hypothetical protein